MAVDWWYSIQYYFNRIYSTPFLSNPLEIIHIISLLISGIFLVGIIHALYKNYQKNKLLESLLFLIGMICLIISAIVAILSRFFLTTWGLPELGIFLTIITQIFVLFCMLLVNLFSIRVTFPKNYKNLLAILLVLSGILIYTNIWAAIQGPPLIRIIDLVVVFSFELMLLRFFSLLPFSIIPISLFFYYAKKVREEKRAHSNRSIWLGLGILFFIIAILVISVDPSLQFIQILFVPAGIIFYVCFSMPDWFKRRIGLID